MITTDYKFNNPHVEKIPPPRELYSVDYSGLSSKGISFTLRLERIPITDEFKKPLNHMAVPKRLGNWELMNEWIGNMWEALYNPIWLWHYNNRYYIIHGNHRFRLLDAMKAESIYAYIQTNDGGTYKIGKILFNEPNEKNRQMNERPPIKGNVHGVCTSCGKNVKWMRKSINPINDVRLYCQSCGAENPYPWRGQI